MAKIVLSYRRDDSGTISNWLYEKLVDRYGKTSIFRDIDSIQPTENFRKRIGRALRDCDFVVAIIGPGWQGRCDDGKSRINTDNDWVRVEVETALQLDIPLLPVLVEGAEMPQPDDLPASLREMTEINALPISSASSRFYDDLERLYAAIEKVTGVAPGEGAGPAEPAVAMAQPAAASPEPASPPPPPEPAIADAPAAAAPAAPEPARAGATAKPRAGKRSPFMDSRAAVQFVVVPSLIMVAVWAYAFQSNAINKGGSGWFFLFSMAFMIGLGVLMRVRGGMRIVHALAAGGVVGLFTTLAVLSTDKVDIEREGVIAFVVFFVGGIVTTFVGAVVGRFVRSK